MTDIKTLKGYSKLMPFEIKHLDGQDMNTIERCDKVFKEQKGMRKKDWEPCWTCREIAKKLGFKI